MKFYSLLNSIPSQSLMFTLFALTSILTSPRPVIAQNAANLDQYENLNQLLEPDRKKYNLPALAAAIIVDGEIKAVGAVGVRKFGSSTPVTINDQFHLGSCTKAITATLIAKLVEDKKLSWDMTLESVFPELVNDKENSMNEEFRKVTLRHLLNHRAGLPNASSPKGMSLLQVHAFPGSPREQRLRYTHLMLAQPPVCKPGSKYIYSNAGFAIAGAVAEQVMNESWESLITKYIFKPLELTSAGFGPMGTPGKIDQPLQHRFINNKIIPIEPIPFSDNPPAIAPAGTIHMNITDWAKFIAQHVNIDEKNKNALLKPQTLKIIHNPPYENGSYAFGWIVAPRAWAGGNALTHAGSNNSNYALVWVAPERKFAVLVMTNIFTKNISAQTDQIVGSLIMKYLPKN